MTAAFAMAALGSCADGRTTEPEPLLNLHRTTGFHGDRRKLGWSAAESKLAARLVRVGFGVEWESPLFDGVQLGERAYPPLVYASPLFVRDMRVASGTRDVVYVATSNGFVYAVAANGSPGEPPGKPGDFLFASKLVTPSLIANLDGGVPLGILSTPIIDLDTAPPRLYVTGHDAERGWLAFALDATNGAVLPGWPVPLDANAISAVDVNGPARFPASTEASQRSALALSPTGDLLYVAFGTYAPVVGQASGGPGWLVSVDTALTGEPRVVRSFSSAASLDPTPNGGMWAPGGPAVDPDGHVWVTTGNSPAGAKDAPNVWGNSLLVLDRDFAIQGTYTPYNYCKLDDASTDVGASAPLLLPNFDPAQTTTPRLAAFGGQQGNVYLVDRDALRPRSDRRPPCESDPERDTSLHSLLPQVHLSARGPLNVFGPFSEVFGNGDFAKMRSRPAYFRDGSGGQWLIVSGSHKASPDSSVSVPPGIAKVRVVLTAGHAAWLEHGPVNDTVTLKNPGSPIVSWENDEAVVWVLDANAPTSQAVLDPARPNPVLYAFAARDLALLWKSGENDVRRMGKYGVPAIGEGHVFVASDRLTAFAPR